MSRFLSERHRNLTPYDSSGEHVEARIKLNTNECPFPPSPKAMARAAEAAHHLEVYPDPECRALTAKAAELLGVRPEELLFTNGSDEILSFIFLAFCDAGRPAAFPEITYSFYEVLAGLYGVPCRTVPLQPDLSLRPEDCVMPGAGALFIANPNSPTGLVLTIPEVEKIIGGNPDSIVVIDEAYIDFGPDLRAGSCVPLIHQYENLIVTQTFSKSRSMVGARLGFGVACADLTRDLRAIRDSVGPYNVSAMTQAAGLGALEDEDYTRANCRAICEARAFTAEGLRTLGFEVIDSVTNFLLARHPKIGGQELALTLKEQGILIRSYGAPALRPYVRISIGTHEQMQALLDALMEVLSKRAP